jgi:type IV secretory pathway VirB10-like protein
MSEPRRWKDSADAPLGMRELLRSARPSRPLEDDTFRRGASRVAKLSVAPAAAAAVSVWVKLAAAGAIGLAAVGSFVAADAVRSEPEHMAMPPAPVVSVPAVASVVASPPPLPPAVTVDEPAPPPPVMPRVAKPVVASASAPLPEPTTPWVPDEPQAAPAREKSTLTDELLLLESARGLLGRSPETALAKLAEHRARYPSGLLASERDLMELDGLRRTGRTSEARERAKVWLAREPNGMHATRVRQILSTLD